MKARRLLLVCLCVAGCKTVPTPPTQGLIEFTRHYDSLKDADARAERKAESQRYASNPDDETRWRLAYAMSRPEASLQQLAKSRVILAEIPAQSDVAPLRDLLDREIQLLIELQKSKAQALELQAQLDALKDIEAEMAEHRQNLDDGNR